MHRIALSTLLLASPFLGACRGASNPSPEASEAQQAADASAPAEPHVAFTADMLEPYSCGSIQRLHTVGGVFLASQPTAEDLEQAKKGGIVTVVDLRYDEETPDLDERAVVEELGMRYVPVSFNGPDELTDEVFDRAREVLRTEERPMLFHCGSANRVGAVWIPYRVLDEGATVEEAVLEAKTIGLKTPAYEVLALEYVDRH